MVRFREAREAAGLKQTEAVAALTARGSKIDVPLLSRIEHGRCLPTVPDTQAMGEVYGAGLYEMVDAEDVAFSLERPKKAAKEADDKRYYKLTVRLDLALASGLLEALRVLGVDGVTAWVTRYAKRTVKRAQKKSAACAATQTTQNLGKSSTPVV